MWPRIDPRVAASALIGLHRAILQSALRRALAGERGRGLAAGVRADAQRALALLEEGLGDYALKPR